MANLLFIKTQMTEKQQLLNVAPSRPNKMSRLTFQEARVEYSKRLHSKEDCNSLHASLQRTRNEVVSKPVPSTCYPFCILISFFSSPSPFTATLFSAFFYCLLIFRLSSHRATTTSIPAQTIHIEKEDPADAFKEALACYASFRRRPVSSSPEPPEQINCGSC